MAKGPNGGPVIDSSGQHVEMVAKGSELVLFLTEADDKPLASAGTKNARAIVQDGDRPAPADRAQQARGCPAPAARVGRPGGRLGYHG
jgi:hypothetical protein